MGRVARRGSADGDPFVTNTIVPVFARHLRARGGDPLPLIEKLGLPLDVEKKEDARVRLSTLRAFVSETESLLNDPFLGVHAAEAAPLGTYGLIEFIARTAPTVGDALRQFIRYQGLIEDVVHFQLLEGTDEAFFEYGADGIEQSMGQQVNEYTVCALLRFARVGSGEPIVVTAASFAHRRSGDTSELERFLGTSKISFGAANNRMTLVPEMLATPLPFADPPLHQFLGSQAEKVAPPATKRGFRELVHERVVASMGRGDLSLSSVARPLGMTPRTLQRRLLADGVSFQTLLDEIRCQTALDLLKKEQMKMSELAFRLGYSDLRPFLRAFKRWTGRTPGSFRDR